MAVVKFWFRSATEIARGVLVVCLATVAVAAARDAELISAPVAAASDVASESRSASNDAEQLAQKLGAMPQFAATFTQAIVGGRGQVLEESTGYILLKRPFFKWVVDDPYPQVIVTEGELLKIYDPDLEQLTIRPLSDALQDTPVSLLTGENVVLGGDYRVQRLAEPSPESATEAREETFVILPQGTQSLFAEIRLVFADDLLKALGILDELGQYTEVRFEVDRERVIQSSDFELEVPPETDVIGG